MTARRARWDRQAWLLWAGAVTVIAAVTIASFIVASVLAGHGLGRPPGFAEWDAGGLAAATLIVAAWRGGRS